MEQTVLIFAYYPFRDPVFQSAVLPYFLNFKEKGSLKFVLLTFEHDAFPMSDEEIAGNEAILKRNDIHWKRLRWRSGKFKIVKKIIDFISAIFTGIRLIRKYRIRTIYTEGFPGAVLSYYICRLTGCRHIVHTFEPLADYMVEAGVWKSTSWESRFYYYHELRIARHATAILTATQLMIEKLKRQGIREDVLFRVPSCVDVNHFKFDQRERERIRRHYRISDNEPVLVYLGKFGGMYMEGEAFDFFHLCQQELQATIMILTQEDRNKVDSLVEQFKLDKNKVIIEHLTREQVPAYLAAADMGFVAVRQWPSKIYCSPIKTGEYLACGLPVVVPLGISDDTTALSDQGVGILMKTLEKSSYLEVINQWRSWINTRDVDELRKKAQIYAANDRSVDRYHGLYAQILHAI